MRKSLTLLGLLSVMFCLSVDTAIYAYGMPGLSGMKNSSRKKNTAKKQADKMSSRYRQSGKGKHSNNTAVVRSSMPAVFVPEGLRDAAAPAAVNEGPGSVHDAVLLIQRGDASNDITYYQQALALLQRINSLPIFPSQRYTKADMYNLMGYASQKLAKTRSEYMTAEEFYKKALLTDSKNIQANKNLGKLYADLYRITGRESFLDEAEKYETFLTNMLRRTQNALSSLTNDIESISEEDAEKALRNMDPDSDWYNNI